MTNLDNNKILNEIIELKSQLFTLRITKSDDHKLYSELKIKVSKLFTLLNAANS